MADRFHGRAGYRGRGGFDYNRGVSYHMDPRKRVPSRSPEGGPNRKQSRPDHPQRQHSRAQSDHASRRSSVSNAATYGAPATHPDRWTSVQPILDPRRQGRINSPGSGNSTPLPKTPAQQPDVVQAPTNNTNAVADLLTQFSSQVLNCASLQFSRDQAEVSVKRSQDEYNSNKNHYEKFAAMKEAKSSLKDTAQKQLQSKEQELSNHNETQQKLLGNLASVIGSALDASANSDMMSRADHEASQNCMKVEISGLRNSVTELQSELRQARSFADQDHVEVLKVSQIQACVTKLENDTKALQSWKSEGESNTKSLSDKLGELKKDLAQHKATTTATNLPKPPQQSAFDADFKSQLEVLLREGPALKDRVDELQKTLDGLSLSTKSVQDLKQTFDKLDAPSRQKFDELSRRLDELIQLVVGAADDKDSLTNKVRNVNDTLQWIVPHIHEEGKESVVKRVKNLDRIIEDLCSDVLPSGKASLRQVVGALEKDLKRLQDDVKKLKHATPQTTTAADAYTPPTDLPASIQRRVTKLEDDFGELTRQQDESDNVIDMVIEEKLQTFQETLLEGEAFVSAVQALQQTADGPLSAPSMDTTDVSNLKSALTRAHNEITGLRNKQMGDSKALEAVHADFAGLSKKVQILQEWRSSLGEVASASTLVEVSRKVDELHNSRVAVDNTVAAVQAQINDVANRMARMQQRTRTASQSATPVPQPPPPPFHGNQGSPQLPNGTAGSPQPNGLQQPYEASPHNNGAVQAPAGLQEIQNLRNNFDGLIGEFRHLKMRCDNLTTDHIVQKMADQLMAMYPNVKNVEMNLNQRFNEAKRDAEVVARNAAQQAIAQNSEQSNRRLKSAEDSAKIQKERIDGLVTGAGKQSEDITELREDVTKTTKTATDTHTLVKGHASRFTNLNMEVVKRKVEELGNKIEEHDAVLDKGTEEISVLQAEVKSLRDNVAKGAAKLQAIDEFLG